MFHLATITPSAARQSVMAFKVPRGPVPFPGCHRCQSCWCLGDLVLFSSTAASNDSSSIANSLKSDSHRIGICLGLRFGDCHLHYTNHPVANSPACPCSCCAPWCRPASGGRSRSCGRLGLGGDAPPTSWAHYCWDSSDCTGAKQQFFHCACRMDCEIDASRWSSRRDEASFFGL